MLSEIKNRMKVSDFEFDAIFPERVVSLPGNALDVDWNSCDGITRVATLHGHGGTMPDRYSLICRHRSFRQPFQVGEKKD